MFIELTEILRCPRDHPESYLVASPIVMDGRRIVRGVLGCPECRAEYPIVDGVAHFAPAAPGRRAAGTSPGPDYDAAALAAFLNLDAPGGWAVLAGRAARHGPALASLVAGVHFVAVNAPRGVAPGPMLSLLDAPSLPIRSSMARAVALGADCAAAPWPGEAVRVLLPGLRVAIEDERAGPEGVSELARGAGMFVGMKSR